MGSPLVGEKQQVVVGENKGEEKVKMKKQLGLLEGVAIILGIIIGSGNVDTINTIMVTCAMTNRNLCVAKGCLERSWLCGSFTDSECSSDELYKCCKKRAREHNE